MDDLVSCEVCLCQVKNLDYVWHLEWHEKVAKLTIDLANNLEYLQLIGNAVKNLGLDKPTNK